MVEARLDGAPVVSAVTPPGGFSHGLAARLTLADGSRVFAKAIPTDDGLARAYRTEAHYAARLPPQVPAPRLRFALDTSEWIALVFDDVDGRHPNLADPAELAAVLHLVRQLASALTPNPVAGVPAIADAFAAKFHVWRRYYAQGPPEDLDRWCGRHLAELAALEEQWVAAACGNTMLHLDLRPDNLLITTAGLVVAVDWSWPAVGAAWVDLVALMPAALAVGIDPDPIVADHPLTTAVPPKDLDNFICALAGYWTFHCRQPPPSRAPTVRSYQAANARRTIRWLERRTGWQ
jgi:aminoglycoside phosphotransferase (APT) family kinase protein